MTTPITSAQNEQLKDLRRLARRRERERSQAFAAEGEDLVAAARRSGRPALTGFRVSGSGLGGPGFIDVEPTALAAASTLGSGTRVVGVYAQRWSEPIGPLCVYLHGVHDPGNVGTVLRSALAFGASSVVLGPGCADPHGPKAVRASMGAVFSVAIARADRVDQLPGQRLALVARAGARLADLPRATRGATTLLIGSEREGLPEHLVRECERVAHIPIASESLNAAMAATVALYEVTRVWAK